MDSQAVQETVRVFTVYVGRERLRLSTLSSLPWKSSGAYEVSLRKQSAPHLQGRQ